MIVPASNLFNYLGSFLGFRDLNIIISSRHFLFLAEFISFALKAIIVYKIIFQTKLNSKPKYICTLLIIIMVGAMATDFSWIINLIKEFLVPSIYKPLLWLCIRVSWIFYIIQYHALAILIAQLTKQKYTKSLSNKIFIFLSSTIVAYYCYIIIFHFYGMHILEYKFIKFSSFYIQPLVLTALYSAIKKIRHGEVPKILKKQLEAFNLYRILPLLFTQIIQALSFSFAGPVEIEGSYWIVGIATILLTYSLYQCVKKVVKLRFLNITNHVQSVYKLNFVDKLKEALEQLSHATNKNDICYITQMFFKETFEIPINRTHLYIRDLSNPVPSNIIIENFIYSNNNNQIKILIYDELTFNNFYEEANKEHLNLLENINADVFIPIYEQQTIIAYIIIERGAIQDEVYGNIERDEMLVFAGYLGNIINLLQHRNLDALIKQEKELNEELYNKHQEINQYKESIHSFIRNTKEREIGILFYKNKKFIFGNKIAKEILNINPNTQEGLNLTKTLHTIARQVEEYKTPQTIFAKTLTSKTIVLSALPNLENNNIIITIYYPEISDIIKSQIDLLKDPTQWDYLLYLETTQSGQLINKLIPSSTEKLLNFKIDLLKTALGKKAILLKMPEEDLIPTVELLHHINLRDTLYTLNLKAKTSDIAPKLFGINPILGTVTEPLLQKLNNTGTLFIQNIHFLDLETQKYLTEFIHYGFYHTFKGDTRTTSNVRIICSTNQDLTQLVKEGKFSHDLYKELDKTTISMPSLLTLPQNELIELIERFTEQTIQNSEFKNLIELTDKEKVDLINSCPISIKSFKDKIQQLLIQKSKDNKIYQETKFDPAYNISDPAITEAIRLGKKALKDSKTMTLLWQKFKNQNKIATLLGVNRSSVNRRYKEYNKE